MNVVKPVYFSDHFNIDKAKLAELGVFDPVLNFDTKVFVEPLLLKESKNPIIKASYHTYKTFFANLLLLLKQSDKRGDKCWRAAKKMVNFPEYQFTCIGYGSGTTEGRGSGTELNDRILQSAIEIVDKAEGNPEIFLLLPLLEEGIAGDRISDMTQNIINDDICRYTIDVMAKVGLKGDCRHHTRNHKSYILPRNPYSGTPIKLLPKDILLNLPVADDIENLLDEMTQFNEDLRSVVNRDIGEIWLEMTKADRKNILLKELKTNKDFFVETLKALKEYKFQHYDLEKDYEGLYRWLKDSQEFISVELAKESKECPDSLESLEFAIRAIIYHFRDTIENKEVWRTFWTACGDEYRHVRVYYSQMLFFTVCNTWLTSQGSNIDVKLHYNNKNIDIVFSVSGAYRYVVHIKHANNTVLKRSYENMLEHCRGSDSEKHTYLVMNFKEEEASQLKAIKVVENPLCPIFTIDVTQQAGINPVNVAEGDRPAIEYIRFEGLDFSNTNDMQSKGGKARHEVTNAIKTHVIKPMFLQKRQASQKLTIPTIAGKIVDELYQLENCTEINPVTKALMEKYDITCFDSLQKTMEYLNANDDGGQIQNWCYQVSNNKF